MKQEEMDNPATPLAQAAGLLRADIGEIAGDGAKVSVTARSGKTDETIRGRVEFGTDHARCVRDVIDATPTSTWVADELKKRGWVVSNLETEIDAPDFESGEFSKVNGPTVVAVTISRNKQGGWMELAA